MRDTLKAAAAKVEGETDKPAGEVKPQPSRDQTGKFAKGEAAADPKAAGSQTTDPKTAERPAPKVDASVPHAQAPARFSPDAKAEWDKLPESVKAETHRALRELEQGHGKYKESATRYETSYKEFDALAKQFNADPKKVLQEYVGIDRLLGENFVGGLQRIAENKGVDLKEVARQILGADAQRPSAQQQPGQGQPQAGQFPPEAAAVIRNLQQTVQRLEQQVTGVTSHVSEQARSSAERAAMSEVEAFAANRPYFNELSEQIAAHITNDGLSLEQAYDTAFNNAQAMARSLGFIPQPAAASAADLEAQTLKGRKSIAGAPSAGSSPAAHKPSSSIRDALRKAISQAAV